ncbi:MAG: hypothetical protein L3J16_07880 [Anaerolineales bacterium]|nr:hypothetical protein [Anaerolineales bacterium]
MNTQTNVEFIFTEKTGINPLLTGAMLDVDETHVRTAAEALDETLRFAQQAQGHGAACIVFVP